MITPERLAEIGARAEAATPGEWRAGNDGGYPVVVQSPPIGITSSVCYCGGRGPIMGRQEDAEFIAHARQDVPDLIAEVERLQKNARQDENDILTMGRCNQGLDDKLRAVRADLEISETRRKINDEYIAELRAQLARIREAAGPIIEFANRVGDHEEIRAECFTVLNPIDARDEGATLSVRQICALADAIKEAE